MLYGQIMSVTQSIRRSLHPELRPRELWLVLPAAGLTLAGFWTLALSEERAPAPADLAPAWVFTATLLAVHLALSLRNHGADPFLLPVAGILTGLGLVMAYRLAPALADRQLVWAVLGLVVLAVVATLPWPLRWLRRYRYTWASLGFALVALTLIFGRATVEGGPRLWLGVGGLGFQPSELLKVLLAVFLAGYLDERRELLADSVYRLGRLKLPPLPYLLPLVVMWGFSLLLLVWQRDLGAAMLFFGIFLAMLYVATGRRRYAGAGLVLFVLGAVVVVQLFSHVRARFDIWFNPWLARPESFQVVQALEALAAGGVLGQGLGQGFPTYIPAVHTDFVFAALGEEIGLAGLLAVLGVYGLLFARGYRIALATRDSFAQLLATGLSTTLTLQTLIIVAGNLKLIPLTGITLPFVSYGGSSLLTNCLMIGLLLRISARS
jgi:cell division protein FtsW (lipid II flippase)